MSRWQAAMQLVGVGFFIAGSIVLGVLAGLWLDTRLNTKRVLIIVGLIVGVIVAFYGVYQMLLPLLAKRNKRNK
jgi:F0F1-type ATP synthase assembly protein I